MKIDYSCVKHPPLDWQPYAIERMLNQQHFALFDDVGMGKCYDTIVTACNRFAANLIDFVLIVAPASVLGVWDDPLTGEIHEHIDVDYSICRISRQHPAICENDGERYVRFFLVSYPYLRNATNIKTLERSLQNKRFMLVADESSHIKNPSAAQSSGLKKIRGWARYRGMLNATPMPNSVMDYFGQFNYLDPSSIRKMNYYQFRNMFAKLGGYMGKNVVGVQNEDLLKEWFMPYVIQRKRTVPKSYATIPVTMPGHLAEIYDSMEDEMIAWLGSDVATAMHAGTKALRLSQITSGYLGGFKTDECRRCGFLLEEHLEGEFLEVGEGEVVCDNFLGINLPPREVDDTKMRAVVDWLEDNPGKPVIIWCRFSAEIERLSRRLKMLKIHHGVIRGGQGLERQQFINEFMIGDSNVLIAQPQAGSEGLNLNKAEVEIFMSQDYNYKTRAQAEGRARPRPGHSVLYIDVLMTKTSGRKTIDHVIKKKVDTKKENETWTTSRWITELKSL